MYTYIYIYTYIHTLYVYIYIYTYIYIYIYPRSDIGTGDLVLGWLQENDWLFYPAGLHPQKITASFSTRVCDLLAQPRVDIFFVRD